MTIIIMYICVYRFKKRVVDSVCTLIGSPKAQELSPLEINAYTRSNLPLSSPNVLVYPKVQLQCKNAIRVICATSLSRATKWDNSCIVYSSLSDQSYGLVEKIIVDTTDSKTIVSVLLKCLTPDGTILCDDKITHAKLNHIQTVKR